MKPGPQDCPLFSLFAPVPPYPRDVSPRNISVFLVTFHRSWHFCFLLLFLLNPQSSILTPDAKRAQVSHQPRGPGVFGELKLAKESLSGAG